MKSDHVTPQESKESKIFMFFSDVHGYPEIKSLPGTVYPDGVMEIDGEQIAIEQTDFHYYVKGCRSCNQVFQRCLKSIADELSVEGYTGCVGIKPKSGIILQDIKAIKKILKNEIKQYLDGDDSLINSSNIIEYKQYCKKPHSNLLIIKPYICDIEGAFTFCECISQEIVLNEVLPKKEKKLINCKKEYKAHWLIISFPWYEHIFIDDLNSKPVETYFNRIFIHEAPDIFIEIPTKEKSTL